MRKASQRISYRLTGKLSLSLLAPAVLPIRLLVDSDSACGGARKRLVGVAIGFRGDVVSFLSLFGVGSLRTSTDVSAALLPDVSNPNNGSSPDKDTISAVVLAIAGVDLDDSPGSFAEQWRLLPERTIR